MLLRADPGSTPLVHRVVRRGAVLALAAALSAATGRAQERPPASPGGSGGDSLVVRERAGAVASFGGRSLSGRVEAADGRGGVGELLVEVVETGAAVRTDAAGRFTLPAVAAGAVTLRVRGVGFRPVVLPLAAGAAGDSLRIPLDRTPVPLAAVVVTPGQYGVLRDGAAGAQSLSREQIAAAPQVGEDLFRIVGKLPGVAASDFSAAFRVRGGAHEEVLVSLDGMELYEPFHLKDFDAALSIVDLGVVGGVELNTGGFGARHGDRLTGVMDVRTVTADTGETHAEAALTLTSLRGNARGTFADGRGSWLWSARRGFLEHALRLAGDGRDVRPTYHDAFGKATFAPSPSHELALHVLHAADRLRFADDPREPALASAYGSRYAWLTWTARRGERLRAATTLSAAHLDWRRDGDRTSPADGVQDYVVRDRRVLRALGARQEWTFEQSDRAVLTWGAGVQSLDAGYDYERRRRVPVQRDDGSWVLGTARVATLLDAEGASLGAHLSQRLRATDALTVEAGVRVDRHERAHATSRVEGWQWSPRLAASVALDGRTTLRAAWGRYGQAQGVHQLQVQDRETAFAPAELAEHRVLGVERALDGGVDVRVEAYERRTLRARPRWSGVDALELFPETGWNRLRLAPSGGVARGVELLLRRERAEGLSWAASYALARAEDEIEGRTVPRPLDQRHTAVLDLAWRPSPAWTVSLAWLYHTGWPTTTYTEHTVGEGGGVTYTDRVYGPRNAERLPVYQRVDARVTRRFDVGGGRLTLFADVFNAFGRQYQESLLPRVPSAGVSWGF